MALVVAPAAADSLCRHQTFCAHHFFWVPVFFLFLVPICRRYGDSFLELLRVELLQHGPQVELTSLYRQCCHADPNYGMMWLNCKQALQSPQHILEVRPEPLAPASPRELLQPVLAAAAAITVQAAASLQVDMAKATCRLSHFTHFVF